MELGSRFLARRPEARLRLHAQLFFSPDGRRLAFVSDRSGTNEVWISNVDGSDPRPLTSFGGPWTGSPSWSPDGLRIALDAHASTESALYVVRVDGGVPERVATGVPDSTTPWWSSDGRRLYFCAKAEGQDQIFAIRLDGGAVTQLTHGGGIQPQQSADGRRIYYIRPTESSGELCSVASNGEEERPVAGMPRLSTEWQASWTVRPSGIYFVDSEPPQPGIGFLDFATGRVRRVVSVPGTPAAWAGLAVSLDERAVLLPQVDSVTSDIMLIQNFR
jgi:Tol biopolymer transport system component